MIRRTGVKHSCVDGPLMDMAERGMRAARVGGEGAAREYAAAVAEAARLARLYREMAEEAEEWLAAFERRLDRASGGSVVSLAAERERRGRQ